MRDILVIGSPNYSDLREIRRTLRAVETVYHGPYRVLVADGSALASYVVGAARDQGWTTELVTVNPDCATDCPAGHRRKGGPAGTYCPTARRHLTRELLQNGPDLVLCFVRPTTGLRGTRVGQADAKKLGLPIWEYEQTGATK